MIVTLYGLRVSGNPYEPRTPVQLEDFLDANGGMFDAVEIAYFRGMAVGDVYMGGGRATGEWSLARIR